MRRISVWFLALSIGCGSGDGKGSSGTTTGTTGTTTGTSGGTNTGTTTGTGLQYTADWDGVQAMIDDHCMSCHGPVGAASTVPFPDVLALDLVTGAGAYVVPEDPAASALWRVLAGELDPADFDVMPQGTGPLPTNQVDHVRLWIEDGAPHPFADQDLDGDGFSTNEGDCDETDPTLGPGADEVCGDGIDNDCSGDADGADSIDATTWYADLDGDLFGDDATAVTACDAPTDYISIGGDCDDGDVAYNPNAYEGDCTDPNDYNCDGSTGFADGDMDGFAACEDCNDGDAGVGLPTPWYEDFDGDGHGNPSVQLDACTQPLGFVASMDDCNDANNAEFPGNPEVCDGFDNDCNGPVDDNAIDAVTWWPDNDGDGYGDPAGTPLADCGPVPYFASNPDDCNDLLATSNPGATEILYNGEDDDCDGAIDELPLSFATDIAPIIVPTCATSLCHDATFPTGGMDLATDPYGNTVNQPSIDVPGMDRFEPFDPANSYIWHKLNNTQLMVGGSGIGMPKVGGLYSPLPQTQLDLIEQWILDGCLP